MNRLAASIGSFIAYLFAHIAASDSRSWVRPSISFISLM